MLLLATTQAWNDAPRNMVLNGVRLKLEALHRRQGRYLRLVEQYNGELQTEEGVARLERALVNAKPAVLIQVGNGDYDTVDIGKRRFRWNVNIELLIVSENLKSDRHQLTGDQLSVVDDGADPGVNRMLRDILHVLGGKRLGVLGDGRVVPSREFPVHQGPDFTMWLATYKFHANIRTETDDEMHATALTDIESTQNISGLDSPPNPIAGAIS